MGCTPSKDLKRSITGFRPIPDRFTSIGQVQDAVRAAGLESSNLILGVDFTKSNTWTGMESFCGRCLHDTTGPRNPYHQVIDIIGHTLETFDDDRLIPAFGFGDSSTGDKACFPFLPDGRPSVGVDAVLQRYKELASSVSLAGPTSFAPVIQEAIKIVREEQSYHILVIIADGQVTDASPNGETARAIIEASNYPLSIVVVGVGDGPWHAMEHYDDELPERTFDNFQFVEWNAVKYGARQPTDTPEALEARFALAALMEIPDQYAFIKQAGLLNPSLFPLNFSGSRLVPTPNTPNALPALPAPQPRHHRHPLCPPAVETPGGRCGMHQISRIASQPSLQLSQANSMSPSAPFPIAFKGGSNGMPPPPQYEAAGHDPVRSYLAESLIL